MGNKRFWNYDSGRYERLPKSITAVVHLRRYILGITPSSVTINVPLLPDQDTDKQIASYIERHFPRWQMCGWPTIC
jgi:hypothetical protein